MKTNKQSQIEGTSKLNSCFRKLTFAIMACCMAGAVAAGPLPVDNLATSPQSAEANQNYLALRALAQANGSVRVDLLFQLPAAVNALNTAADMQAREAAVLAEVASFQSRYAASIVGTIAHASLTPMIQADISAAGIDQLRTDPAIQWFSKQGVYTPLLNEVNNVLQTSSLPLMGDVSGNSNATIAIIDSGVDVNHPEFSGRVLAGACYSTSTGNFVGGSNPLPSLCLGRPETGIQSALPCESSNSLLARAVENCGHGTHVAGVAAGRVPNLARSGIAPAARLIAFQTKSLQPTGRPARPYVSVHNSVDVVKAFDEVLLQRPTVAPRKVVAINMSFGTAIINDLFKPWTLERCQRYDDAIERAIASVRNQGIAVVVSAGNDIEVEEKDGSITRVDFGMAYPACSPLVTSVAATSKSSTLVGYSVYGFHPTLGLNDIGTKIASIAAPGGNDVPNGLILPTIGCTDQQSGLGPVCSAQRSAAREQRSGTSMSAPAVAALIARLVDRFPSLTGVQAADLLVSSGTPLVVNAQVSLPKAAPVAAFRLATLPRDISAATPSCGIANLNWLAPFAQPGSSYHLRFANSPALPSGDGQFLGNVNSFQLTGLTGPLVFQLRTQNGTEFGEWSDSVSATPTPCAPNAVASFRSADGDVPPGTNGCFAGMRWSANTLPAFTRYQLEEVCSGGVPTSLVDIAPNSMFFRTHSGPIGACDITKPNQYRIQACNVNDCGPWSAAISHLPSNIRCEFSPE